MATLEHPSPPRSPSRMPRKWARKVERYCCLGITYFPLAFVYGITSWAVWVEASIGFQATRSAWIGNTSSLVGIILYMMLNWSYTTAVFTNPGSTIELHDGYNSLPTQAPPVATHFTVKSTGELRFCKKCNARKPDRAHHCSTCRRCVLKMDHHCPWLATCVGLKNYKAFLLFLTYTTLFCFMSFAVSGSWFWSEILSDAHYNDTLAPVNNIMLAVISGIIGIVLFGFTGWHILLASRGQTTIECLEKTRYLSPLRKAMQTQHIVHHEGDSELSYGQQLADIHTNALPGVTRPEEGEVTTDTRERGRPYQFQSYDAQERQRARDRYEEYLDEQDSAKLPSAFDLGWRRNLSRLFGPKPSLWLLPICSTVDDGWSWEPSPKWLAAREQIKEEREAQLQREQRAGWGREAPLPPQNRAQGAGRHWLSSPAPKNSGIVQGLSKADRVLGREPGQYSDFSNLQRTSGMPMQDLSGRNADLDEDDYEISSDEQEQEARKAAADHRVGQKFSAWHSLGDALGRPPKAKGAVSNQWGQQYEDDDID